MSWREHWPEIRSSVEPGDVISGCRDNESRSYRLFVNKGWRDVQIGSARGHQMDSCECCDLSLEDMKSLIAVLEKAVATHRPWPGLEE